MHSTIEMALTMAGTEVFNFEIKIFKLHKMQLVGGFALAVLSTGGQR